MSILNLVTLEFVKWGVGAVGVFISGWVFTKAKRFTSTLTDNKIAEGRAKVNAIQNENLRVIAEHVVRYVGSQFPDVTGSERMQIAIRKAQELTPDIIISDESLKIFIESAYTDLKNKLVGF